MRTKLLLLRRSLHSDGHSRVFTNAAIPFSSARSPYSFSLRDVPSGHCSTCPWTILQRAVLEQVFCRRWGSIRGHISDWPIFDLRKRGAFSLLGPVRSLNRKSLAAQICEGSSSCPDLLQLECCWRHFFSVRVLMSLITSLKETCFVVPEALPLWQVGQPSHLHTKRERKRETDRQTETERQRQRETQWSSYASAF